MTTTEPIGRTEGELVRDGLLYLGKRALDVAKIATTSREKGYPNHWLDKVESLLGDLEWTPDPTYWRDYFLLTGAHMVLTDEGWEPGATKAEYDPEDIYDEVNEPAVGDDG